MKIAFIGLGNLGAPMARCLIAARHTVTGFDTQVQPDGINCAKRPPAAVAGAKAVITLLPNAATIAPPADDTHPPQTVAIEVDPLDSVFSRAMRIVYGKSFAAGSTPCRAREASLPSPI